MTTTALTSTQADAVRAELQAASAADAVLAEATLDALTELRNSLQAISDFLRGEIAK